ncbi:hypothetical protein B0H19DRAFT_1072427 [Mycena capillaripes]|nr:hypothetical protein B0H19DRAFT_1072427 [Mycena capillaripes]
MPRAQSSGEERIFELVGIKAHGQGAKARNQRMHVKDAEVDYREIVDLDSQRGRGGQAYRRGVLGMREEVKDRGRSRCRAPVRANEEDPENSERSHYFWRHRTLRGTGDAPLRWERGNETRSCLSDLSVFGRKAEFESMELPSSGEIIESIDGEFRVAGTDFQGYRHVTLETCGIGVLRYSTLSTRFKSGVDINGTPKLGSGKDCIMGLGASTVSQRVTEGIRQISGRRSRAEAWGRSTTRGGR